MTPITFEALVEMAEAFEADGTLWHFYMIGPKCCFGQSTTMYRPDRFKDQLESVGFRVQLHDGGFVFNLIIKPNKRWRSIS